MINGKSVLCIIPARSGSKGIKDKNIKKLNGIPLIAYTINCAKKVKYIDEIIVSTDSQIYADIAVSYGAHVPFLRPLELSTDKSKTIDSIIFTINKLKKKYEVLLLLQPTSPLRRPIDVENALCLAGEKNFRSVLSVNKVELNPFLIREINEKNELVKLLNTNSTVRRQDVKTFYTVNGSIYINLISELTSTTSFNDNEIGYVVSAEDSLDIDSIEDFILAEKKMTLR